MWLLLNIPNTKPQFFLNRGNNGCPSFLLLDREISFFIAHLTYHRLFFLCHGWNIWKGEKASSYFSSKYCFHRNKVNRVLKNFLCCIAFAIVCWNSDLTENPELHGNKGLYSGHLSFHFSLSCFIHANLVHLQTTSSFVCCLWIP